MQVDWFDAQAYASWAASDTGQRWRLPMEWEWEKAARGVDGRLFPWGDTFDASRCCVLESHSGRALPQVVDRYPIDVSPYGVRGMAGNMSDWCGNPAERGAPVDNTRAAAWADEISQVAPSTEMAVRGGGWFSDTRLARVASRVTNQADARTPVLGFRLARSW